MDNIVWRIPGAGVAITHVISPASAEVEAERLKRSGDIPPDYIAVALNADIPPNRVFREAWGWSASSSAVDIDIDKAKEIVHTKRRNVREARMRPYDNVISRQVPGADALQAENSRQVIRQEDAALQVVIDNSTTTDQLSAILNDMVMP